MARPRKNTPTAKERIIEAVGLGATYERAAAAGGIGYSTLREWILAEPEFAEAVKAAEAKCANEALIAIKRAARGGQWQAAAWLLERRYPSEYGRTVQEQRGQHQLTVVYKRDWRGRGEPNASDSGQTLGEEAPHDDSAS